MVLESTVHQFPQRLNLGLDRGEALLPAGEFMLPTKYGGLATLSEKRSLTMSANRLLQVSVFAILLTFFLLPAAAHASDVTVGCPGGSGGTYSSITAALAALPQNGPNTITVTGTCNEDVSLIDVRSLKIIAGAGGAKIVQPQDSNTFDIVRSQNITLQGLEIAGVPGSTPGFGGVGVNITEASDVHLIGCDIHNNEGGGVLGNNSSVLFLRNTNIHNNTPGDGLVVVRNSTADVAFTTIHNNGCAGLATCFNFGFSGGVGVFVTGNSIVNFRQNNLIENNADIGIWARLLSTVGFGGDPTKTTTIQGHNIDGIIIQEGAHLQVNSAALIQGNGGGCPPETPIPCGGIFASENATVEFQGFTTISGNHGAGIFVDQGTNLHLGGGVTVSNNTGDGVHIRRISIGDFTPIPGSGNGNNTITGNGGASVFCDARSLGIGNLSTFSNVRCGEN
jgi:parallel beta helix pectate lyase-like protein